MKTYQKNKILLAVGVIALLVLVWTAVGISKTSEGEDSRLTAIMYKTPTCGCCQVYGQYLKRENVDLTVVDVEDMSPIKDQHGIPGYLESCHTTMIEGYVVEGHIPMEIIEMLLSQKPDIKGIALPGMPSGSPGMPGPKTEQWIIYAIGNGGEITEFMKF